MNINGNINPQWTFQMLYVYWITIQRYSNFNCLYLRTHEILLSLVSILRQSLANGVLQEKMTFKEIREFTESVQEFCQLQHRNYSLVEREYAYFELIMHSNSSNLKEIFSDVAYNMNDLLVSVQKKTKVLLKEIQEITDMCMDPLSTDDS